MLTIPSGKKFVYIFEIHILVVTMCLNGLRMKKNYFYYKTYEQVPYGITRTMRVQNLTYSV